MGEEEGRTIIVTAGPTNERIDSVMRITNMATGALGCAVVDRLLDDPALRRQIRRVYYISPRLALKPTGLTRDGRPAEAPARWGDRLVLREATTAQELLETLTGLLAHERIDAVVHSAAVGDYRARYSIRAEDLADEICAAQEREHRPLTRRELLGLLERPARTTDDSGKMSSYEQHLMTMLQPTPKVIGSIKKASPSTLLIGFKLLDGAAEDELLAVARRLRRTNRADYIVANDLSRMGRGHHWARIVGEEGVVARCADDAQIADAIARLIFGPARRPAHRPEA